MENKVSSSNPNVKNVTVPTANKLVNSQQPRMIPVKGAKNAGEATQASAIEAEDTAELEPVSESSQTQKLPKVTSIAPEKKQAEKVSSEEKNKPAKEEAKKDDDEDIIEKIREDAEEHEEEAKKLKENNSDAKQLDASEGKVNSKDKEKIRIVIRDAKPPIAARILQGLMRVICLLLIVAVCGIGIPRLFGINEFNVLTASMTPTYPTGSLVFVQPKDPSTIRPGEVVTCVMSEDLDMVTHRVMSNNYDDKTLTTKGDANAANDAPHLYENVVGVVVFSIPYVGGVVDYLTNDDNGRVLGIGAVLCILALTFIAEAICFLLTKQAASVYDNPSASKSSGDGKGKKGDDGKPKLSAKDKNSKYEVTSINARKFNREFRRGKGKPVESVPPRDQENKQKKKHKPKSHAKPEGSVTGEEVSGASAAGEKPAAKKPAEQAKAQEGNKDEPKKRGIA